MRAARETGGAAASGAGSWSAALRRTGVERRLRPRSPPRIPRAARDAVPGTYSLLWKKPSGGEVEIEIAPVVPEGCGLSTLDRQQLVPGAAIARATLLCDGGLAGKTLAIAGLEATITDVLVRVHHADGRLESHLLRPTNPAVTLGGTTTGLERAASYLRLGVQHIVLGVDHLLFVLGLLLIVADRWMLAKTVTAFTVAHSITLAIATLGYASAPLPPLNAAIALSILFLGPEIVRTWRGESSFTIRHPWVVAFAFGLLHGFGFASGLADHGPAARRDPARAAALQRRRRARPDGVRGAGAAARAIVPHARDPLAGVGRGAAGLRGRAGWARSGRSSASSRLLATTA